MSKFKTRSAIGNKWMLPGACFLPVRPSLEYCIQAWLLNCASDTEVIKKVEEITTRSIPGLTCMTYTERFRRLKLFSLQWKRLRGDLVETFKFINSFVSVNPNDYFTFSKSRNLREHPLTLPKPRVLSSICQQSVEVGVIDS